jgi:hypothetical protein
MMASSWVGTTRPEGRELRACGLAALAESGVLVLPCGWSSPRRAG